MNLASHLARFSLQQFRPGQRQVIDSVLAGRDCLCIMPTGGGKSLCYQLPAVARAGLTVVVSPLIALMKDQVDALQALGIPSTFINSSLEPAERNERTRRMVAGEYALMYVAPERLRGSDFVTALRQTRLQLLAIDEAHCISQWGHDFRPDYGRLGQIRQRLQRPQTIALTATATRAVQQDIIAVLQLSSPDVFVSGFARENLRFRVLNPTAPSEKDRVLADFLRQRAGSGIIYAATRKNCEQLVDWIPAEVGRPAALYHAGLEADDRRSIQEAFMADKVSLIVATNAFGMGIDKRQLRFVVHYNIPGSLEAYYQEAGRAGRDGLPAECLLLYSPRDRSIQQYFIESHYPPREAVRDVYRFLSAIHDDPIELTLQEIKDELGLSIAVEGIRVCQMLLERAGVLERLDSQSNLPSIRLDSALPTLVDLLPRDAVVQRKVLGGLETVVGEARGERVYFHPQRLADSLGLPTDSLARALRALQRLAAVDYVPSFRGRAVHLLRRDADFDSLPIDFSELEARKRQEYDRLEEMIGYVFTGRCRQRVVLEYFGDPEQRDCGQCDRCRPGDWEGGAGESIDAHAAQRCWYALQVALSGAARAAGRIGRQALAQMLIGSQSKKMKSLRLDQLPTFGRLSPLRQEDALALLGWLLEQGLLEQVETTRFRPIVRITADGQRVMTGTFQGPLVRRMPRELVAVIAEALRFTEPAAARSAPHAASGAPRERQDPGGETAEPAASRGELAAGRGDRAAAEEARPPWYWTWILVRDGYAAEEVMQIRGLSLDELRSHLADAERLGEPLRGGGRPPMARARIASEE